MQLCCKHPLISLVHVQCQATDQQKKIKQNVLVALYIEMLYEDLMKKQRWAFDWRKGGGGGEGWEWREKDRKMSGLFLPLYNLHSEQ